MTVKNDLFNMILKIKLIIRINFVNTQYIFLKHTYMKTKKKKKMKGLLIVKNTREIVNQC